MPAQGCGASPLPWVYTRANRRRNPEGVASCSLTAISSHSFRVAKNLNGNSPLNARLKPRCEELLKRSAGLFEARYLLLISNSSGSRLERSPSSPGDRGFVRSSLAIHRSARLASRVTVKRGQAKTERNQLDQTNRGRQVSRQLDATPLRHFPNLQFRRGSKSRPACGRRRARLADQIAVFVSTHVVVLSAMGPRPSP